jgi:hypothetical protein
MKKISSEKTRYTLHMLKSGVSLVNWFIDMVSVATDADFGKDKLLLRFIWLKMEAEMRDRIPRPQDSHDRHTYLGELRKAQEGMCGAVQAQDGRIAAADRQKRRPRGHDRHQQ